jgi:regulator of cell morphogenesis and NO signaling
MTFSPDTTVGEVAGRFPATTKVFQRLGVEFCCGGPRTLGEVCRSGHIEYDELAADLVRATLHSPPGGRWAGRPLVELTDHLVEGFHDPLRQELPRLAELARRLHGHGDTHRRVLALVEHELARLAAELSAQMEIEESEFFPLVIRFERRMPTDADRMRFTHLAADARACHADAGQTLRILRQITDGYVPPSTACSTLRALYRGLHDLEQLMQLHVHLESNVLFSRAAALMSEANQEKH